MNQETVKRNDPIPVLRFIENEFSERIDEYIIRNGNETLPDSIQSEGVFDGNTYVGIKNKVKELNDFTILFRFKADFINGSTRFKTVIQNQVMSGGEYGVSVYLNRDKINAAFGLGKSDILKEYSFIFPDSSWLNKSHDLALVFSDKEQSLKMYVDQVGVETKVTYYGALSNLVENDKLEWSKHSIWALGGTELQYPNIQYTGFYRGTLPMVQVFDQCLSQGQIREVFQNYDPKLYRAREIMFESSGQ